MTTNSALIFAQEKRTSRFWYFGVVLSKSAWLFKSANCGIRGVSVFLGTPCGPVRGPLLLKDEVWGIQCYVQDCLPLVPSTDNDSGLRVRDATHNKKKSIAKLDPSIYSYCAVVSCLLGIVNSKQSTDRTILRRTCIQTRKLRVDGKLFFCTIEGLRLFAWLCLHPEGMILRHWEK